MFRNVIMSSLLLVFVVISSVNLCYAELTIEPSGKVGIGTTSPIRKLDVNGDLYLRGDEVNANTNIWLDTGAAIEDQPAPGGLFLSKADGPIHFRSGTGNPIRMSVSTDGNVGIGTTNPISGPSITALKGYWATSTFSVNPTTAGGGFDFYAPGGNLLRIFSDSGAGSGEIAFYRTGPGGNEIMRLNSSGNVGIGTSSPGYKLHVNGTAAGTSWTNLSSREYKDNIKKVDSSKHSEMLAQLMKIELATYNYKQEYSDDTTEKIGFIAEDMPKEVLSIDGKGVDIYELLTYTIGAMKAQQETVMTIKEEIKTLKAENGQLRNTLTSLTDRQKTVESMLLAMPSTLPKEKLVMK